MTPKPSPSSFSSSLFVAGCSITTILTETDSVESSIMVIVEDGLVDDVEDGLVDDDADVDNDVEDVCWLDDVD